MVQKTDTFMLGDAFKKVDRAAWRAMVDGVLKGKPYDKVMLAETLEGLTLQPLYAADNASVEPQPAGRTGAWGIDTPHWNPDVAATNAAILEDLERGATGIVLKLAAGGTPGIAIEHLGEALKGVYLDLAPVTLLPGEDFALASEAFLGLVAARGHAASSVTGTLGIDPLGVLAQTGRLPQKLEAAIADGAAIAARVAEAPPGLRAFMVDAGIVQTAGGTAPMELGYMLSAGLAYLRAMEAAGVPLSKAVTQLSFVLATDPDMMMSVAKFRAARRLWARVQDAMDVTDTPAKLTGVLSLRSMTIKDPWVNILRATAAGFAAGIGGADSVCLMPHDTMLGLPSAFSRRIARNVQVILQEESNAAVVNDPAAGAWSFETITAELAREAWDYFQKIEAAGGAVAAVRAGLIAEDCAAVWQSRRAKLATRKEPVTGVSEFPNIDEKPLEGFGAIPVGAQPARHAVEVARSFGFHRYAEDYERLRLLSDAMLDETGARPAVYLATLGSVAEHTGRVTFAKNFFEAGGVAAHVAESDDLAAGFRQSGATVAVLCGSDARYEEEGLAAVQALKDAGAVRVIIAGRPANADNLAAHGVSDFIFMGSDVIASLSRFYEGEAA
ncbi:methylmalonyl-CoA mutase family protein [Gimibacter soli]|uniref:Methylmalonyl-CoA mutase family protein n=1 Tax=Gimibacter soli TaxID=3024400 RepID=A0AAF0BJD0_9PROT|nr:methylmalonyl-CoA mutase family protein [Gimibacter soli]WCL52979.1 methylmalonyl-CoA mutase family protein [Gimibacter soli]